MITELKDLLMMTLVVLLNLNNTCWSECRNLRLSLTQSSLDLTSNTAPTATLQVRGRTRSALCQYFVGFSKGGGATFTSRRLLNGSNQIGYQLYKNFPYVDVLKDKPTASVSNDVLDISHTANSTFTDNLSYRIVLSPPTGYERFGVYSDTFNVVLYDGVVNGAYNLITSLPVNLTYTSAKKIDLSLVDTSSPFNLADTSQLLNFGNLYTNESRDFDVIMQFNAGYSVFMSSINNSRLKHSTQNVFVPYTLTLDGAYVNLETSSGSPVLASSGSGVSPAGGLRKNTVATIGTVSNQVAGNYTDNITITVSSTE